MSELRRWNAPQSLPQYVRIREVSRRLDTVDGTDKSGTRTRSSLVAYVSFVRLGLYDRPRLLGLSGSQRKLESHQSPVPGAAKTSAGMQSNERDTSSAFE